MPPPVAPDVDPAYALRGFRVPSLVISPLARRRYVAHGIYDHTSILRLIEWRWNLTPLSVRDAHANNIASALDLGKKPKLRAEQYFVPAFVSAGCTPPLAAAPAAAAPTSRGSGGGDDEWTGLETLARNYGFPVT